MWLVNSLPFIVNPIKTLCACSKTKRVLTLLIDNRVLHKFAYASAYMGSKQAFSNTISMTSPTRSFVSISSWAICDEKKLKFSGVSLFKIARVCLLMFSVFKSDLSMLVQSSFLFGFHAFTDSSTLWFGLTTSVLNCMNAAVLPCVLVTFGSRWNNFIVTFRFFSLMQSFAFENMIKVE